MTESPVITATTTERKNLRARLLGTRWSEPWPTAPWAAGTDQAELRRLVEYWASDYDWTSNEERINELPFATVEVGGTTIRYLRFDGESPTPLPLILTNGWPSTALDFIDLAQRLSLPTQYGRSAADAFTVIIPVLPGFPLSPPLQDFSQQTHHLWHALMSRELGFDRYGAHGSDLGAGITSRLAQAYPDELVGIHLLSVAAPQGLDGTTLTEEERQHRESVQKWLAQEGGYQHQQQTRPLSLAPGLSDSPAGLLAWILEKYRNWSDPALPDALTDDYVLTQASLYWFTNTIASSFWPYYQYAAGLATPVDRVDVPTALAVFPSDIARPPRSWAARTYDIVRYRTMEAGGHFASHEVPELVAADITEFFRPLR